MLFFHFHYGVFWAKEYDVSRALMTDIIEYLENGYLYIENECNQKDKEEQDGYRDQEDIGD